MEHFCDFSSKNNYSYGIWVIIIEKNSKMVNIFLEKNLKNYLMGWTLSLKFLIILSITLIFLLAFQCGNHSFSLIFLFPISNTSTCMLHILGVFKSKVSFLEYIVHERWIPSVYTPLNVVHFLNINPLMSKTSSWGGLPSWIRCWTFS